MKWTLPYLEQHMGSNKHTVYISKDNKKFKFYDEKKVSQRVLKGLTYGNLYVTCVMQWVLPCVL